MRKDKQFIVQKNIQLFFVRLLSLLYYIYGNIKKCYEEERKKLFTAKVLLLVSSYNSIAEISSILKLNLGHPIVPTIVTFGNYGKV